MTSPAKDNILRLPDECYGILPSSGEVIIIRAGESGYYKTIPKPDVCAGERYPYPLTEELVRSLNNGQGVTEGQRRAMESGSMFGWETPGADARNYTASGEWSLPKQATAQEEKELYEILRQRGASTDNQGA